jgi:hypothetical protein
VIMSYDAEGNYIKVSRPKNERREPKKILNLTMYASRAMIEKFMVDKVNKGEFAAVSLDELKAQYLKVYEFYYFLFFHTDAKYEEISIEQKKKFLKQRQKRET